MTIPTAHGPFRAYADCLRWTDGRLAVWLDADGRAHFCRPMRAEELPHVMAWMVERKS
jgi:hypothetical protein